MGEVAAIIKVMPASPEVDLEAVEGEIRKLVPDDVKVDAIDQKPFAFGLKALDIALIFDGEAGERLDEIVESFEEVDGVQSAKVETVGLM